MKEKLSKLCIISTGLVVNRKQASSNDDAAKVYNVLTIKSFDKNGILDIGELDKFRSKYVLPDKHLTQVGDVVIRLSAPYTAIVIRKGQEEIVIPSLFVVIRVNTDRLIPEYLSIYLNSERMKKQYARYSIGSTIQIIKTGMLRETVIECPTIIEQKKIAELNRLILKEKTLLARLVKEKEIYYKAIMSKMIEEEKDDQ